ncbi:MAG TPA: TIGR03013 family PEP-CTERM/XrtA system glycosyltransferase [Desulfuromonadales bacterium]|nr:TIGR03013 family PEP-CTERM/XrtA system glycosyltransferase [Desulfuromonadales bacterium]
MTVNLTILILLDAILAVGALFLTAAARLGYSEISQKLSDFNTIFTAVIFVVLVLFSAHLMEVYDLGKNIRKREIVVNILFGAVTSFSLLSVVFYLNPEVMLGRGILILALCCFALLQFCWHALYLMGKNTARFCRKVLVLGTGPLAAEIGAIVAANRRNFTLVGYAACQAGSSERGTEGPPCDVPSHEILGNSDNLRDIAKKAQAGIIVVALSERRGVFPLRDVLTCKLNGIEIMDAPSFYETAQSKLMLESITPGWFIFSDGFHRTNIMSAFKRGIDIVLSCIGLLLTLPFFPLIAAAIKLDSPGPVFFKQERMGSWEKRFLLFKFRTMRQDAEKATGAVWAEKNDPRVTKLGRFFRGSRIDEIPQLFNVLSGSMSFVGPRPERPEFVEKLKQVIPYYSQRHFIKPGLTGWAQVRYPYGASVEDAVEKLRYDLYYIKNTGPFLDTLIFFETIKVVLFGFGGR